MANTAEHSRTQQEFLPHLHCCSNQEIVVDKFGEYVKDAVTLYSLKATLIPAGITEPQFLPAERTHKRVLLEGHSHIQRRRRERQDQSQCCLVLS